MKAVIYPSAQFQEYFIPCIFKLSGNMTIMVQRLIITSFFCVLIGGLSGQIPEKKDLTTYNYDNWNELEDATVSANGKWAAYQIKPQVGDGTLFMKDNKGALKLRVERGYDPYFLPGDSFLIFKIKPQYQKTRKAKLNKKKPDEMPKDTLAVYNIKTGELTKHADIKNHKTAKKENSILAFSIEKETQADSSAKKEKQTFLYVHYLKTKANYEFGHVKKYLMSRNGKLVLVQIKNKKDSLAPLSIVALNPLTGKQKEILKGKGEIKRFALDKQGEQFAYLFSQDTTKTKVFDLYYQKSMNNSNPVKLLEKNSDLLKGHVVSEHKTPWFSETGGRLFFDIAPKPAQEEEDTLTDDEKVIVDIWNWKDDRLQPAQKVHLERDKKKGYASFFDFASQKTIQVQNENIEILDIGSKGEKPVVMGTSQKAYKREASWDPGYADYYAIDMRTGKKTKVAEKVKAFFTLSPNGRFFVYYDQATKTWCSLSVASGIKKTLTQGLGVNFYDEEWDYPTHPHPYGFCGWDEEGKHAYVYDRYDIWRLDPKGEEKPLNLTKSQGRKQKIRFRYQQIDKEQEHISPASIAILKGFNEKTKGNGFYKIKFKSPAVPHPLIVGNYRHKILAKAHNANKLMMSRESYREYPDAWFTDLSFKSPVKLTETNPQQKDYNWGTVELTEWTDNNGKTKQGLLYKPENFDPNKKYPLMVYFYRRHSENLHQHYGHFAHRSVIVPTLYNSQGYMVFMPDIDYETGYPGQSCLNSVVSGTLSLIQKGFIDKNAIGVQGQSWGGYQTAYLITQINLFKAAMAGTPVSNMTSAYGGIRWATGISRMFQYEKTQSRMGGTLWEKPLQYIWNSPLFFAERVHTPLLIRHDDADGAVPWYQGIEYFVALRRLNKPVWMLNYNDEPHNLQRRANKIDFARRMKQFFDHYLKGNPMPQWMDKGVPYIKKGREMGYGPAE